MKRFYMLVLARQQDPDAMAALATQRDLAMALVPIDVDTHLDAQRI